MSKFTPRENEIITSNENKRSTILHSNTSNKMNAITPINLDRNKSHDVIKIIIGNTFRDKTSQMIESSRFSKEIIITNEKQYMYLTLKKLQFLE